MEAALAFRGIDLLDLWRGRMSLRRLKVLLEHMGEDELPWSAIRAKEEANAAQARVERLQDRANAYQRG